MPTSEARPAIKFDVERIFTRAGGGPGELLALLEKHNETAPTITAVAMWKSRSAIPTAWLAPVLYAMMREGHRVFELMVRTK